MIEAFLGLGVEFGFESVSTRAAADSALGGVDGRHRSAMVALLGRLHPLVVHFPIALAIAAAAVEFLNILRRKAVASPFAFTATVFAAIAACVAAWSGWLNADFEGATPGNTLFLHRWLGVVAAGGLCVVAVVGCLGRGGTRPRALNGYRWGLVVCAVVVGFGAHFGGTMVYGEGYLTKVLFAPSSEAEATTGKPSEAVNVEKEDASTSTAESTAISFRKDVLPILEARCVECHGPNKVKGGLRMDTADALFSGDPQWWPFGGEPDKACCSADRRGGRPQHRRRAGDARRVSTIGPGSGRGLPTKGRVSRRPRGGPSRRRGPRPDRLDGSIRRDRPSEALDASVSAPSRKVLVPRSRRIDDWEVNASTSIRRRDADMNDLGRLGRCSSGCSSPARR